MATWPMHYADGRLDHEEYDERLDAIWTARTRANLSPALSDLPGCRRPTPRRRPVAAADGWRSDASRCCR